MGQVLVKNPSGDIGEIPAEQQADALQSGYSLVTPDELKQYDLKQKYGEGLGNEVRAGAEGFARSATFGLSDQALTKSGFSTPEAMKAREEYNPIAAGAGEFAGVLAPALLSGGETLLAKGAAALGAPVRALSGAGQAITRAATPLAEKAVGSLISAEAMPLASRVLSKGVAGFAGSAVEGAAYGLGQSVSEEALGDPDLNGEKILSNIGYGALLGGGFGAAIGGGGPAIKAIQEGLADTSVGALGRKILSTFGGVAEKDIAAYQLNREAVNAAPELQEVYDYSLNHVETVLNQVDNQKMTFDEAQASFKKLESEMKETLRLKGYDAKIAESEAKRALKDAQAQRLTNLQQGALDQGPEVAKAAQALRDRVTAQSAESYQVLERANKEVDLGDFFTRGETLIKDLEAEATSDALAHAKSVREYLNNVKRRAYELKNPSVAPGDYTTPQRRPEGFFEFDSPVVNSAESPVGFDETDFNFGSNSTSKGPKQKLDNVTSKNLKNALDNEGFNGNTGFEVDVDEAKRVLQRRGDKAGEKEIAEYIKQQKAGRLQAPNEPTGPITLSGPDAKKLIQGLDKISTYSFGASVFDSGRGKAFKQLRYSLDDVLKDAVPEYRAAMKPLAEDTALLKKLSKYDTQEGATRGLKSIKNPDAYMNEMPLLKQLEERTGIKFTQHVEPYANPKMRAKLLKSMPEFAEAERAADALQSLRDPRTLKMLSEELVDNPLYIKAQEARSALDGALAAKDALGGLTPVNLESKLKSVMSGRNINNAKLVSALPEFNGMKINDVLEMVRLAGVFEKGAMNGSRHVNMFAGVIGGIAGTLGGAPLAGMGAGAAIGGIVDKYGPAITKRILDLEVKGMAQIERRANEVSKNIFSGAKNIFNTSKAAALVTASYPSYADHSSVAPKITELVDSPQEMMNTLEGSTQWIYNHAPKTAGSVQMAAARATSFLHSKLPINPNPRPLSPKFVPSKAEISKFNRYYQTIQNPVGVLHGVKTGMITKEQMETLATVYPSLLHSMQTEVMNRLTEKMANDEGASIPYRTKMALSMFLGQDLDSSLEQSAIQANQMLMTGQKSSEDQAQTLTANPAGMKSLSLSNRSMTAMQSIAKGDV